MNSRLLFVFVATGALALGAGGGLWAQAFLLPYLASRAFSADWQFVQDWNNRATLIRETTEVVIRLDDAAERVAARAEAMVVGVESRGAGRVVTGSGFAITSDGFLLTTANAVPQGYEISIYFKEGEKPVKAEVLKRDSLLNLVVLKIEVQNLQTTGFENSDSLRLGAPVVMVAKSLEAGELVTIVGQGNVRTKSEDLVRTSMIDKDALEGSPLLNLKGNIVGLVMLGPSGRVVAVPVPVLRAFSGF